MEDLMTFLGGVIVRRLQKLVHGLKPTMPE
jgi:hypothetical protein